MIFLVQFGMYNFQKPQIALAFRARAILLVFEIFTTSYHLFQIAFGIIWLAILIVMFFFQLVEYSVSTGFVASRLIWWIELLQISWFSIKNGRSRLIRCLSGYGSYSSYQLIDRIADQYLSTSAGRVLFISKCLFRLIDDLSTISAAMFILWVNLLLR